MIVSGRMQREAKAVEEKSFHIYYIANQKKTKRDAVL
jgi:hypothetical protein